LEVRILPLQPTYYVGERIFQAVLSMLVAALGYILFLKSYIIPPGTGVFNIYDNVGNINYEYKIEKETPP
jgi:hypothetical protein